MSSCEDISYLEEVQEVLKDNPFVTYIKGHLYINEVNDEIEFKDGWLFLKELLYIPLGPIRLKIIQICHDLPAARPFCFNKTMEFISRDFRKTQMWKLVKEFI